MKRIPFSTNAKAWYVAAAGSIGLGLLLLVSYVQAGGNEGRAFIEGPAPEEPVVSAEEVAALDDVTDPLPPALDSGPRSQDLESDFRTALERVSDDPLLTPDAELLSSLTVAYAADIDIGVPVESVQFRTGSLFITLDRQPRVGPSQLYHMDPDGGANVEFWDDGAEAAIRVEDSFVQIILVKGDQRLNVIAGALNGRHESPFSLDQVRVIAQAMAADMPGAAG